MARSMLILANEAVRRRALAEIAAAEVGSRVEIKDPKRTLPQNDRFWAMLSEIAKQDEHMGVKYDAGTWKDIILHAMGREIRFVPAWDGTELIPTVPSSSDLSVKEMSDCIEFMFSEFIPRGVIFHEPPPRAERRGLGATSSAA